MFLPTTEQVRLLRLYAHQVTKSTAAVSQPSVFLTPLDVLNRSKGYSLFLPDNYEAFRRYWELGYGVQLPEVGNKGGVSIVLAHIETETGDRIVPAEALCR